MQHYTTTEQSKKLAELGLSPKTADMYYFCDPTPAGNIMHPTFIIVEEHLCSRLPEYDKGDIPCWSLGTLLELMPKIQEDDKCCGFYPIIRKGWVDNQWYCLYTVHITRGYDNSTDAAFEMIVWLLKNNYIKKGE